MRSTRGKKGKLRLETFFTFSHKRRRMKNIFYRYALLTENNLHLNYASVRSDRVLSMKNK